LVWDGLDIAGACLRIIRSTAWYSRDSIIPWDDLRKVVRLFPDTLEGLLRALVATGQVTLTQAGGQRAYRAAT
jgi:hypothetical protein